MSVFLPLSTAAAILYRGFLPPGAPPVQTEAELDRCLDESARLVAIAIAVYRTDLPRPVRLSEATLASGTFRHGGRELVFGDGRGTIGSLGVIKSDLDAALARRADLVPESRPETILPSRFSRPKLER